MASSPQPKRPKMSSSDDEHPIPSATGEESSLIAAAGEESASVLAKRKQKRRKIAVFLAYCGAGYQGMQKNPGARTIESDLEEALFLAGAVPESDRGCPNRYDWARSARTDKGVSATGQVVSGRFYIDPPGFVDRLNAALSPKIRVFGFKRATASFNAKKFCDRRRYVYLLPVFTLDPSAHPDRESVATSLGSGSELARCLECSERGRKVPGIMGRQAKPESFDLGNGDSNPSPESENRVSNAEAEAKVSSGELQMSESSKVSEEKVETEISSVELQPLETRISNEEGLAELVAEEASNEESKLAEPKVSNVERINELVSEELSSDAKAIVEAQMSMVIGEFQYGEKEKERFNGILKRFEGTHNFHNFTTRTKAEDPSAQRYIISFTADSVMSIEGIDFVKCEVIGQSFMLHQIRKMIGFAVAIMRNSVPESLMDIALRKDININVPTAPEVGLYLDECFFASYNKKWKDTHEELSMESYAEQAEEFKVKYIYSHIASMEHKEGAVALWLHSLNHRNYPDFNYLMSNGKSLNIEKNNEKVDNLAN